MENKEFGKNLEIRTQKFAIDIINLSSLLPNSVEGKIIRNQITKYGTSVGAKYRVANQTDFINKIKICESEAHATIYWLEIIQNMNWNNDEVILKLLNEDNEIVAIFTSIGNSLKQN